MLYFFGGNTGLTEEWNGTNWSETTETGEYFSYKTGGGGESSEAAIWVGHTYGGRSAVWNGSNWSEISDMIALGSPNREGSSFGTSTSFLIGGGGIQLQPMFLKYRNLEWFKLVREQ